MTDPIIHSSKVFQGSDIIFRARVVADNTNLVIADVDSWDLRVFESNDSRDGRRLVDGAAPDDYFFDTLQTTGWTRDTTGYNFQFTLEYDSFKGRGGREYRFEFKFVTADYGNVYSVWLVKYLPIQSV